MKTIRTKAIVLRRTNYGESDRIIQFLTPNHGILSAMAKSVRKEKSRLAGGIELFAVCDVTIGSGKGDLGIVTNSRLETFFNTILSDYERLQFGYEAIKQVTKAANSIDEVAFFDLLEQTFICLNDTAIDVQLTESWFWLQLAIILGVGINLRTDSSGERLSEDRHYEFSSFDQGFVVSERGAYTSDHIKILRVLSAQPPNVAVHIGGIEKLLPDVLWVARHSLAH